MPSIWGRVFSSSSSSSRGNSQSASPESPSTSTPTRKMSSGGKKHLRERLITLDDSFLEVRAAGCAPHTRTHVLHAAARCTNKKHGLGLCGLLGGQVHNQRVCVCVLLSQQSGGNIFFCRSAAKKVHERTLTHSTPLGFALRLQGSSPGSDVSMGYFNM